MGTVTPERKDLVPGRSDIPAVNPLEGGGSSSGPAGRGPQQQDSRGYDVA